MELFNAETVKLLSEASKDCSIIAEGLADPKLEEVDVLYLSEYLKVLGECLNVLATSIEYEVWKKTLHDKSPRM